MSASRRAFLHSMAAGSMAAGLGGVSLSGWFPRLAHAAAADPSRKRHCILLWMSGGPSQTDTFDLKPDHENGGEFEEIQTSAPGLRFSEHLPKLATMADKLAVLRGLSRVLPIQWTELAQLPTGPRTDAAESPSYRARPIAARSRTR